jgi:sugar phosphate isomerase/epimerase
MKRIMKKLLIRAVWIAAWAAGAALLHAADKPTNAVLPNVFYAMDNGVRDANHTTPESQIAMLKELGYPGIGWRPGPLPEMFAALDKHGLKLFSFYANLKIGPSAQAKFDPALPSQIAALKGRDTILWFTITSRDYKPSAPEGDEDAVTVLRQIADMAKAAGLRVALYPHTGMWLERVQDAVRLARKVQRDNVGASFTLCHCLRVGDEKKIPELLAEAKPHLFLININGADAGDVGPGWSRLIMTLDQGSFDMVAFFKTLKRIGYTGPIALQSYNLKGDVRENLKRSLEAWRKFSTQAASD